MIADVPINKINQKQVFLFLRTPVASVSVFFPVFLVHCVDDLLVLLVDEESLQLESGAKLAARDGNLSKTMF